MQPTFKTEVEFTLPKGYRDSAGVLHRRGVMRLASQQSVSYAAILAMVTIQIATGAAMGLKKLTTGAFARNVQVVSGWYLAVFLCAHVFMPYLLAPPASVAPVAPSLTPPHRTGVATLATSAPPSSRVRTGSRRRAPPND